MTFPQDKTLITIVGPTAIGKTALSITLAKHFKTEIISADSRQIFKEMSIGTAKPTKEEMGDIPHHFIDAISIHDEYNAGKFEREGLAKLTELFKTHDKVIMVGGSGLYVDAICRGFDPIPEKDDSLRNSLKQQLTEEGIEVLQQQLKELDPEHYNNSDLNNGQRIIRALEVCITSGKPYSSFRKAQEKKRPFNIVKIGLTTDREVIYNRINQRVDIMIEQGLLNEVKGLHKHKHLNALQTVGYKELFDHFDSITPTLEEAIEILKRNTRRFAKRQLTWFRRDEKTHWFEPNQEEKIIQLLS